MAREDLGVGRAPASRVDELIQSLAALGGCLVLGTALGAGALPWARSEGATIRVDVESFWYEHLPRAEKREPWETPAAPRGSSRKVQEAVHDVLTWYPHDFPQPPPLDIVVRAQPREDLRSLAGYLANRTSYGGARRVGDTVYIDVHQTVFTGSDALNESELRAFLGHELRHAYQYSNGSSELGYHEILRREIEAYSWEIEHFVPGVRTAYRNDTLQQLHMNREMLGEEPRSTGRASGVGCRDIPGCARSPDPASRPSP